MNKKTLTTLLFLVCILVPWPAFAQDAKDEIKNFLAVSPENPFLPVLILIGSVCAFFTVVFPKFGLIVILLFMFISTDIQLDQSVERRATTIRFEDILLVLISGGWLLNRAKTKSLSLFRHVPINRPIIMMSFVLVIASLLGYLQGTLPMKSGVLFTLKRLEYFWLFFMTLNIMQSNKEVKVASMLLIWLTLAVTIVGIIQFYLFPLSDLSRGGISATSGFGRVNILADLFLLIGGVLMGLIIYVQSKRKLLLYLLVMSLCAIALIMTKSRGAYVSIPPLIATIVFFSKSRKALLLFVVGGIVLAIYIVGVVLLSFARDEIAQGGKYLRDKHSFEMEQQLGSIVDVATEGPKADSSFNARYSAWVGNIDNILEYPIFGHGVGSVPLSHFDCQYVMELYETGFVGFIVFMYMNFAIFMTMLTFFHMTDDPFIKGITCGFLGGHVGMLVHGWSIANFYTIMNMEIFWFLVAIIMVMYHNHITKESEKEQTDENEFSQLEMRF